MKIGTKETFEYNYNKFSYVLCQLNEIKVEGRYVKCLINLQVVAFRWFITAH